MNYNLQSNIFYTKYIKYKKKYLELKKLIGGGNPYLIITAGPTGSGKGSLPDKIIKYLNLNKNERVNILIDDIVENQENYKKEIKKIINKYCIDIELCKNLKDKINNPDDEILKNFNDIYFNTRKNKGCNNTDKTCDNINDEKLENAFKNGKNIIFETTGTYYPSWIFKYNMEKLNEWKYEVIMAWTIADWCELVKRNSSRAIESFEKFIKDNDSPGPRLPDIRSDNYKRSAKIINDVFYRIAFNCGKTFKIDFCKKEIRLIVVDNRTKNNTNNILYDSFKGSMSPDVEKVFNFTRISCDYK
jgi:hypothetical protein